MKIRFVCFLVSFGAAAAAETPLEQLFDAKLTPTQRANACFELRDKAEPEVVSALARALEDPDLLSCAAAKLRKAGAVEPLKQALSSPQFQVRAAAARELGLLQKPEVLELLSRAAKDENALVATNALSGLSEYQGPEVIPYLASLASKGGMTGDMALDRLWQLEPRQALDAARTLLASSQVPDKLYAMRIIGASGDTSDLPVLKQIATDHPEAIAQRDRGFGFMPAINLARAANSAIAAIESRVK